MIIIVLWALVLVFGIASNTSVAPGLRRSFELAAAITLTALAAATAFAGQEGMCGLAAFLGLGMWLFWWRGRQP